MEGCLLLLLGVCVEVEPVEKVGLRLRLLLRAHVHVGKNVVVHWLLKWWLLLDGGLEISECVSLRHTTHKVKALAE
jgi:hypothetical protein